MTRHRVVISYPTFPSSNYEFAFTGNYSLLRTILGELIKSELDLNAFPITIAITELK